MDDFAVGVSSTTSKEMEKRNALEVTRLQRDLGVMVRFIMKKKNLHNDSLPALVTKKGEKERQEAVNKG